MWSILVCTTHKSSVVKCPFSENKSRFIRNTKILWQFSFCVKLACLANRYMDSFENSFLYFQKKILANYRFNFSSPAVLAEIKSVLIGSWTIYPLISHEISSRKLFGYFSRLLNIILPPRGLSKLLINFRAIFFPLYVNDSPRYLRSLPQL